MLILRRLGKKLVRLAGVKKKGEVGGKAKTQLSSGSALSVARRACEVGRD